MTDKPNIDDKLLKSAVIQSKTGKDSTAKDDKSKPVQGQSTIDKEAAMDVQRSAIDVPDTKANLDREAAKKQTDNDDYKYEKAVLRVLKLIQTVFALLILIFCVILIGLAMTGIYEPPLSTQEPTEDPMVGRMAFSILVSIAALIQICGLLGSVGNVLCCQITYCIFMIVTFPYVVLSIVIAYMMIAGWGKPPTDDSKSSDPKKKMTDPKRAADRKQKTPKSSV